MQNITSDLANGLMAAESAGAFLLQRPGQVDWQVIASIKTEVDRLSGCDLNRATQLADRLADLSYLIGDRVSQAFAEASSARVLDNMGRHAEANALYEKAAATLKACGLETESAIVQKQQLHALIQLGRYQSALQVARGARRVLLQADPIQLGQLEGNIGNIYYQLDRYRQALTHYDRARAALSQCGDEIVLAINDFSRANVLAEMDQPDKALELLQKAAVQFDRGGRSIYAEQARFHAAYLYLLRGNYNASLATFHRARDRVTELGSHELAAYCSLGMAQVLLALNAFEDAAENSETAREIFERLKMPFESARAYLASGLAAMGLRQVEPARTRLVQAREAFEKCGNAIFTALSDSYWAELAGKTGDYMEMLDRARSAVRVFSRNRLLTRAAYARLLMARAAYELQDWAKAVRWAKTALRSVEGRFAPGVTYQCYHLLGCIQRDRNRPNAALDNFRRSVGAVEQMREWILADEFKASFLQDKSGVYEDAIAACLNNAQDTSLQEAFRLVESSKSRALADLLVRYMRGSNDDGSNNDGSNDDGVQIPAASNRRARFLNLVERLNWYISQIRLEEEKGKTRTESTLDRYRSAALRCERQIKQLFSRMESEDLYGEAQQVRPASEADLRAALLPDETAVEFFITGREISAFIVSSQGIRVVRSITSRNNVDRLISALRFQLDKLTYEPGYLRAHRHHLKEATNHYLEQLYHEVFSPLRDKIANNSRLIIVPHGVLHYLPFHALYDGTNYLIDRFEISYAPSAAVLKLCRTRSAQRQKADCNGAANEPYRQMVSLGLPDQDAPHIEDEIRMVSALFPDAIMLLDGAATCENLFRYAPGARFLHLSSHGVFRRDNPMFSFLKLADCQLNFYSLLDLRLRAEMVTLSACQTGVNALLPGDELHGLMRGFLSAGAPAMTVSLWKVADRSTAELMAQMYLNIRAGQSKRAALRNAQLTIKKSYDHPYYWAPFVLMGNPD